MWRWPVGTLLAIFFTLDLVDLFFYTYVPRLLPPSTLFSKLAENFGIAFVFASVVALLVIILSRCDGKDDSSDNF